MSILSRERNAGYGVFGGCLKKYESRGFNMICGNYPAKIDEKSRLRLPAKFRRDLPETADNSYYVTSVDGKCARVYPIAVWERIARKLQEAPQSEQAISKFQRFTSFYGAQSEMDPQGRILIPTVLREKAQLFGDVSVIGKIDYLEVWNMQIIYKDLEDNPITSENWEKLAEWGI